MENAKEGLNVLLRTALATVRPAPDLKKHRKGEPSRNTRTVRITKLTMDNDYDDMTNNDAQGISDDEQDPETD